MAASPSFPVGADVRRSPIGTAGGALFPFVGADTALPVMLPPSDDVWIVWLALVPPAIALADRLMGVAVAAPMFVDTVLCAQLGSLVVIELIIRSVVTPAAVAADVVD